MSKKNNGLTRQGVRDLGFSRKAKTIELPPEAFDCAHKKKITDDNGVSSCIDCGQEFRFNKQYNARY